MSTGTERRPAWRRQNGYALLASLLVVVLGAAALYVAAKGSVSGPQLNADPHTARALAQAREIVMARALGDEHRPGSLPCAAPGTGGSGTYDGDDCDADFGRFPYRTLDSTILRDAADEPLWYVMDPAFRDRVSQQPINPEEKPGALEIGDRANFAAVILAPGEALQGQVEDIRDDPEEFFEAGNDTAPTFTRCADEPDCNDRLRGISTDELFNDVQRRVVKIVTERLNEFYEDSSAASANRYLPDAEDFAGSGCVDEGDPGRLPVTDEDDGQGVCGKALREDEFPDWVVENEWLGMVVYHVDPACTQSQRACAETTINLDDKRAHAIVVASGRALSGGGINQNRPGSSVEDYLDSSENRDLDPAYETQRLSRYHNDVLGGVGGDWP